MADSKTVNLFNLSEVNVSAKLSLLHTIAKSIYASPKLKVKEAVSNSIDNNASKVFLKYDERTDSLSIFDNGNGISFERLKLILQSIGNAQFHNNEKKNSYFGLGLFSVLELGAKVTVFTRTKANSNELNDYSFKFNTSEIFSEKNRDKPLSDLNQEAYITVRGNLDEQVGSLINSAEILEVFGEVPVTFTEIFVEEVDIKYKDYFSSNTDIVKLDLSKTLPLSVDIQHNFFSHIADVDKLIKIKKILGFNEKNSKVISPFTPSLDFFIKLSETSIQKLDRYLPTFDYGELFTADDIRVEEKDNYAYFFLFKSHDIFLDKNTEVMQSSDESLPENYDNGFWVRNRNILVKGADFFQKSGYRNTIVQAPLRKWIYGEILHTNFENALIVTRDDYEWGSLAFNQFYLEIKSIVAPLNKPLRTTYNVTKQIYDSLIEPVVSMSDPKISSMKKLENKLNKINISYPEAIKTLITISSLSHSLKDKHKNFISNILDSIKGNEFTFFEDDVVCATISKDIQQDTNITSSFDYDNRKAKVMINSIIFNDKKIKFFNSDITVKYVLGDVDKAFYYDDASKTMFINIKNEVLSNYTLNIFDVFLAFEISFALFKDDVDKLKSVFYELISGKDKRYKAKCEKLAEELLLRRV